MNFNGWNNFEDFARACGYTNLNNNSNSNSNSTNNSNDNSCYDIPNGFQSLNPELFVIIGTLLGEIIAGRIPFNVQNALGNWFSLIGQVIMTYNAQQQYFEEGPGTCFNPKHFNSNNSSCSSSSNSTSNNSTSNITNDSDINTAKKIQDLENKINSLIKELEKIKRNI